MAHVTFRTQNADGEPVSLDAEVEDDAAEESVDAIERYAELEAESRTADLRSQLQDIEEDAGEMRDIIVSDILRRQKLSGEVGEEADLSVEDQRDYLQGLPADRLKMEWERAPKGEDLSGATSPATTGDAPDDGTTDLDAAVESLQ
jgi:hypothetical protein